MTQKLVNFISLDDIIGFPVFQVVLTNRSISYVQVDFRRVVISYVLSAEKSTASTINSTTTGVAGAESIVLDNSSLNNLHSRLRYYRSFGPTDLQIQPVISNFHRFCRSDRLISTSLFIVGYRDASGLSENPEITNSSKIG